jgi:Fe2+ or Zn2+ uptake regulation protein
VKAASRDSGRTLLLLLLALVAMRLALMAWLPLMDTTEARYAEIGRKMLASGDWITPWHGEQPFWGKPVKAYDLLELVREGEGAGAAAPPTVYRALDFLLANGFIHKLESVNAFVACHHPSTAQHSVPFLICDRCHSAVELEDKAVVAALDERARALGFVPQAQTLEVHGLCARCTG